jgi:hypothetical protein
MEHGLFIPPALRATPLTQGGMKGGFEYWDIAFIMADKCVE